jgi:hypothetical protein
MITAKELFESGDLTTLDFCLWVWVMSEIYKIIAETADALLSSILDAAAHIKKREDQLRRTKRHFRSLFISF